MNLDAGKLTEEELLHLMVQEPRLLRRPLIVIDGKPIVGFDREALSRLTK
jgi:arsenate reductase-like glutaredoxin family protein